MKTLMSTVAAIVVATSAFAGMSQEEFLSQDSCVMQQTFSRDMMWDMYNGKRAVDTKNRIVEQYNYDRRVMDPSHYSYRWLVENDVSIPAVNLALAEEIINDISRQMYNDCAGDNSPQPKMDIDYYSESEMMLMSFYAENAQQFQDKMIAALQNGECTTRAFFARTSVSMFDKGYTLNQAIEAMPISPTSNAYQMLVEEIQKTYSERNAMGDGADYLIDRVSTILQQCGWEG